MITKTAIGNYLRKQPNGDVGMYRNGFKDGVQWAQQRLAAPVQQPATRPATRDEKIVNPEVYVVAQPAPQPDVRQMIEGAWVAGYYEAGYTNDRAYAEKQAKEYVKGLK
jgi:hypothetical protein